MTLRRAAELVAVPWRNGAGITRDVAAVHGPDGALRWQVSIAELAEDCDFSDYAGFDRVFTPVAGNGIRLSHDGGPFLSCPPLAPHAFPGEARTRCRIGGEAGRAFNVIAARAHHRAAVHVLHRAAGAPVQAAEVLHCWSGRLHSGDGSAGPGDSLVGVPATTSAPSVIIRVSLSAA